MTTNRLKMRFYVVTIFILTVSNQGFLYSSWWRCCCGGGSDEVVPVVIQEGLAVVPCVGKKKSRVISLVIPFSEENNKANNITTVDDVNVAIILFLEPRDYARLRLVSKTLCDQIKDNIPLSTSFRFLASHMTVFMAEDYIRELFCYRPHLTKLIFTNCRDGSGLVVLMFLSAACTIQKIRITSLDFTGCLFVTDSFMNAILQYFPLLGEINLSGCSHITDRTINCIIRDTKLLTKLNISDCQQITKNGLVDIATYLTKLKYLSVARNLLIDLFFIEFLGRGCKGLKTLVLTGCVNI